MNLPQITPIKDVVELLKVVADSELWTKRIVELKEYQEWINTHLDIGGTLEEARQLVLKTKAVLAEAGQRKIEADKYASDIKDGAEDYAAKQGVKLGIAEEEIRVRGVAVEEKERALEKSLAECETEREHLAKLKEETVKTQQLAHGRVSQAEAIKQEYVDKLATMKQLAN